MDRNDLIKNINLINLALSIILLFQGFKYYTVLNEPLNIPVIKETKHLNDPSKKPKEIGEEKILRSDYEMIYQKDLFRRSRSPLKKEEISKLSPPPFSKGKPQLSGTIILNDINLAFIKEIDDKKAKVYSLGGKISGFVIKDIKQGKVILAKGDQSVQINLMDPQKKRKTEPKKINKKQKRRKSPRRVRKRRSH